MECLIFGHDFKKACESADWGFYNYMLMRFDFWEN